MFKIFKINKNRNNTYSSRLDRIYYRKDQDGFIASITVVILATGILAISFSTLAGAISYSESVYKRELRIQANLNANACLDKVTLMVAKDYFLSGEIKIQEFGCIANITNDFNGGVSFVVESKLAMISARLVRVLRFQDFRLSVI